jgi:hypothetical protein
MAVSNRRLQDTGPLGSTVARLAPGAGPAADYPVLAGQANRNGRANGPGRDDMVSRRQLLRRQRRGVVGKRAEVGKDVGSLLT